MRRRIASTSPRSSSSNPSAWRADGEAPAASARRDLLRGARRDHRVDARVDPGVERVALHRQRDEQRREARLGGPELVAAGRLGAGVEQLQRAHDALRVGRRDGGGGVGVAGGELGVQRGRALALERRGVARARIGVGRRAEVELGERGAQVQPGAADHDRPPAGGDQRVDLGVRAAGEVAGGRARGEREDAEQPVLEPGALSAVAAPVRISSPA